MVSRALVLHTLFLAFIHKNRVFSARSGIARNVPIYCHLYATILLMSTANMHTSWYLNLFIVIFQEMTHVRSIVTLLTLIAGMMFSSLH